MKTKLMQIKVPESWLIPYSTEINFLAAFEKWLEDNAPCETCGGSGFVLSGEPHDPNTTEIGCEKCNHQVWENPLE